MVKVTFPKNNPSVTSASLTLISENGEKKTSLKPGTSFFANDRDEIRFRVNEPFTGGGWALVVKESLAHDDF